MAKLTDLFTCKSVHSTVCLINTQLNAHNGWLSLGSDTGRASCGSCSCGHSAISSHPPGAASARGPFLIQALCWRFMNASLSLGSPGAHGRRSAFFPLVLLQMSSSLRFLFFGLTPRLAVHASLNAVFQRFLLAVSLDAFQLPRAHSNHLLNTLADELGFSL